MSQDTNVENLIINKLTKAQYESIGTPDPTQLYMVTDAEIQADSVTDQNNIATAIKTWTGTKAQYDAIVTKDANTLYNVEDTTSPIISILESLYPVGSIYIGTMSACPLQALGVGTWQLVAADRVLQGAGTRGSVGSTINEKLPNITGNVGTISTHRSSNPINDYTGAFRATAIDTYSSTNTGNYRATGVNFDASRSSSTYQNNAPVQQDAYLVNIWERIS